MSPEQTPERIPAEEPSPAPAAGARTQSLPGVPPAVPPAVPPDVPLGDSPGDPRVGSLIADRYRVVAPLATGGMGMVYQGEHVALHRRVAMKFLHPELARIPEVVARFEREAVAAAALDHPNVVGVTDFGRTSDGSFFLVMEFIEGRTLREVLDREGRLPFARALRIARQIGAALTRAHALGIVHRDLKPENVMLVDREGASDGVKVVDFGIAKVTAAQVAPGTPGAPGAPDAPASPAPATLTRAGMVYGTPDYMPPEQALGAEVDAGADQYAFGVVLFEMLTGVRPFHADDVVTLLASQVSDPPPRASVVCPGAFPPALDEVFARMLAKHSADRFPSLPDAMAALDAATTEAPPPAVPAGSHEDPASAAEHLRRGGAILLRHAGTLASRGWTRALTAAREEALRTREDPRRARGWARAAGAFALGTLVLVLLAAGWRHGHGGAAVPSTPPSTSAPAPGPAASPDPGALPPGHPPGRSPGHPPGATPTPAAGRDVHLRLGEYLDMQVVRDLRTRARNGQADAVMQDFEATYATTHDGVVAYVIGAVGTQARRYDQAVRWFDVALQREPALADDPALVRDVLRAECSRHPPAAAETLLAGPLAAAAAPMLIDEALQHRPTECRDRAGQLLRSPAFASRAGAEVLTLLDLQAAGTCEARRGYVVTLGRTGGPRSLPLLQRIQTVGCSPRAPTCNACLADVLPGVLAQIRRRSDAGT